MSPSQAPAPVASSESLPPASDSADLTVASVPAVPGSPFTLLGDPDALACEGDSCALPPA